MSVIHEYIRSTKKFPHVWCSGCGIGVVLASLIRAIDSLQLDRNEVILISGIGCSSRAPVYVDFNTLHTTHGRALSFATGIKMAKPHLKVIVIMGDGDATAIGGNHLIHTCRRNIDLTTVIINNSIYGMTGGQYSPTTPHEGLSTTSPFGNIEAPFDICNLVSCAGATFVARGTVYYARQLEKMIRKGIEHRGFSVIEAITPCPTLFGRLNKMGSAVEMLNWQKQHALPLTEVQKRWSQDLDMRKEELKGKFLTGVFTEREAPEFVEEYQKVVAKAKEKVAV